MKKITPYMILKGLRYLKHFGPKEFLVKLRERMEPEEVPYGPWYEHYRLTPSETERQTKEKWKQQTLFSVVVPAYKTPEKYLREMVDSVLAQTYPYWELCIVNASPEDTQMDAVLEEYAAADKRIRVLKLEKNLGIAGNTNAGLEMAKGDFIALLDHDDLLSPSVLFYMAKYLQKNPDTGVLYTDEDKIREAESGYEHFQPNLKPDYNPDLLRSNNYICHFLAVRAEIAVSVGGFGSSFDGAQDHDFLFRCIFEAEKAGLSVGHIPEILYHWRVHAASTADNPASKMYAYEAGKRAIEGDLARRNLPGTVELKKELGFYRVRYGVREESRVSIIIPNKDEVQTLKKCLESIWEKTTYKNYEIIVVENNSVTKEILDYYKEIQGKNNTKVIRWKSGFNYAAINNYGFAHADGDYIICLNNDIEVISPDWIQEMLGICQRPDTGVVGARLYYPDDTVQHAGIMIGIGGIAGSMFVGLKRAYSGYMHKAALLQDMSAVTAACMMVSRKAWEAVNGFDERLTVAFNDVDFCLRIREQGLLVVYDPYVEMYHYESKTRGAEDTSEKVRRFQSEIELMRSRWTRLIAEGDPYYNKNFSLHKWNYSLKPEERMR